MKNSAEEGQGDLMSRVLRFGQEFGPRCRWQQDSDGTFQTDCGQAFILNDGTPEENHMRFCCYCGLTIQEGA